MAHWEKKEKWKCKLGFNEKKLRTLNIVWFPPMELFVYILFLFFFLLIVFYSFTLCLPLFLCLSLYRSFSTFYRYPPFLLHLIKFLFFILNRKVTFMVWLGQLSQNFNRKQMHTPNREKTNMSQFPYMIIPSLLDPHLTQKPFQFSLLKAIPKLLFLNQCKTPKVNFSLA